MKLCRQKELWRPISIIMKGVNMKKIINILIIIILTLLVLNCNCYAFDFEFNSNTYSINRDISSFPTIYEYSSGSFHFSKYILILNCENNT